MIFQRQALARLAVLWLVSQLIVATLTPAALCVQLPLRSDSCTCAHGDGQVCPMHHAADQTTPKCSCTAPADTPAAVLGALLGVSGVLPALAVPIGPAVRSALVHHHTSSPLDLQLVPDAPPPRA